MKKNISTGQFRIVYYLLWASAVFVSLIAGVDKFFNFLADWQAFFPQNFTNFLHLSPQAASHIAGAYGIAVGLMCAFRPRIGGAMLIAMYFGIIIILLLHPDYFNLVLLNIGLLLSAVAFWILAKHTS